MCRLLIGYGDESGRSVRSCEYSTKCGDGED